MNGADRVILDKPAYSIFESTAATNATISAGTVRQGCESFGPAMNARYVTFHTTSSIRMEADALVCDFKVEQSLESRLQVNTPPRFLTAAYSSSASTARVHAHIPATAQSGRTQTSGALLSKRV